jgi:Transposase DDE domain/Insertion element 4 transposase N-terminal
MAHSTKGSVLSQVQIGRQELESSQGLPFRHLLNAEKIEAVLERAGVEFRERIFSPTVTLWAFLSQVVASKDSSCKDAVSRVLAERVAQGQKACSPDTSSYCQARARLPEQALADLTRETGQGLHRNAPSDWLWKGRRVQIVDGSTSTMDDTPENQAEYPQSKNQKAGLGFPMLRFVVLLSLATGAVLECALGACRGKKTGEQSLFRQIWGALQAGDIVLGDRLYDAYRDSALLKARGVDVVFGKKQSRRCDFRCGRRLGQDDHVVIWKKPKYDATRYESKEEWQSLPAEMEIREVRVTIRRRGHRTRTVVIVTTLLDAQYSAQDLTDLFAERWRCELDLRSIKRALGMYHLSCKSPEMVRKELWMHLLAYNLIRVRMAQAAAVHGAAPRRLSFSAAQTLIHNFAPHLITTCGAKHRRIEAELLQAIGRCRLPNRPGRKEPRAVKKRDQKYSYLTRPRAEARKRLAA